MPMFVYALLGLVSAHFDIEARAKQYEDIVTEVNAGIAVVTPAAAIMELLMREDVVEEREKRQREASDDTPAASYDVAQDPTSEFERFEGLTRRLIQVPKSELDEKRQAP